MDAYTATEKAMASPGNDLTMNGCHLNEKGYQLFASTVFKQLFGKDAPKLDEKVRAAVVEKNKQHFFRYRPLNTFYYTGGRNRSYGYLDFLPAMRNFDLMTANRDDRIHALAARQEGTRQDQRFQCSENAQDQSRSRSQSVDDPEEGTRGIQGGSAVRGNSFCQRRTVSRHCMSHPNALGLSWSHVGELLNHLSRTFTPGRPRTTKSLFSRISMATARRTSRRSGQTISTWRFPSSSATEESMFPKSPT